MAVQRTFSILKPDVTRRNLTGAVNAAIEKAGLRIVAQKRVQMTRAQAETFYAVHKGRPFFGELVDMMSSAPVVVQVLEGEDAIARYREAMGAHQSGKGGARHHPQGIRAVDGRELGARLRRAGNRGDRDRAILPRQRDRRLTTSPLGRDQRFGATSANIAPCGSNACATHWPVGTSIGPLAILPPALLTRATAASIASTLK